ncbi:hypothetical protein BYT27DRAFT_7258733 [Phlegmacium glaucopus]|nr:hypothetical protein BYT27DRAFT_7258733 [Phlegmacium glaucopus]
MHHTGEASQPRKKSKISSKNVSNTYPRMSRQTKAAGSRITNLEKPGSHPKASMEDVSEDEDQYFVPEDEDLLEHSFFFVDKEDDTKDESDYDSEDEEAAEDELNELKNKAALNHFNSILVEAQAMAVKAE